MSTSNNIIGISTKQLHQLSGESWRESFGENWRYQNIIIFFGPGLTGVKVLRYRQIWYQNFGHYGIRCSTNFTLTTSTRSTKKKVIRKKNVFRLEVRVLENPTPHPTSYIFKKPHTTPHPTFSPHLCGPHIYVVPLSHIYVGKPTLKIFQF